MAPVMQAQVLLVSGLCITQPTASAGPEGLTECTVTCPPSFSLAERRASLRSPLLLPWSPLPAVSLQDAFLMFQLSPASKRRWTGASVMAPAGPTLSPPLSQKSSTLCVCPGCPTQKECWAQNMEMLNHGAEIQRCGLKPWLWGKSSEQPLDLQYIT